MNNLKTLLQGMAVTNLAFGRACFRGLAITTAVFAYLISDSILAPAIPHPSLRMYAAAILAGFIAWMVDSRLYEGFTCAVGARSCPEYRQADTGVKVATNLYLGMYAGRLLLSVVFTLMTATFSGEVAKPAPTESKVAGQTQRLTSEANKAHAAAIKSADRALATEQARAERVLAGALAAFPADQRRAYAEGKWTSAELRRAVARAEKEAKAIDAAAVKAYEARVAAADKAHAAALALASQAVEATGGQEAKIQARGASIGWFTMAGAWIVDLILIFFGTVNAVLLGLAYGPAVKDHFPEQPGLTDVLRSASVSIHDILVGCLSWLFSYVQVFGAILMTQAADRTGEAYMLNAKASRTLAMAQQGKGGGGGANRPANTSSQGANTRANTSSERANSSEQPKETRANSSKEASPTPPSSERPEQPRDRPEKPANTGAPGQGQAGAGHPGTPSPTLAGGGEKGRGEVLAPANTGANSANSANSKAGANSAANSANSTEADIEGLRRQRQNASAKKATYAKRAEWYRRMAEQATDPDRVQHFNDLALGALNTAEEWQAEYIRLIEKIAALVAAKSK